MGYRGFLKPKPTPLSVAKGLLASQTVLSRAAIGLIVGLVLGVLLSLAGWWICFRATRSEGVAFPEDLWETLGLPVLFFWGVSHFQLEDWGPGEICLMFATNGLLVALPGGLIGWYVGRLRKLRQGSGKPTGDEPAAAVPVRKSYLRTIGRQAGWGFCVGVALSVAVFAVFLFKVYVVGGVGEAGAGMWLVLTLPSYLFGLMWPDRGLGSELLTAATTCLINGALLGALCGAIAALMGPVGAPADEEIP